MNGGYRPWFENYPELFEQQKAILESAGFKLNVDRLRQDRHVLFTGILKSDSDRELIVVFPDAFPSAAPKIHDTPKSKLLSRHHRVDNRQLCLFGFNENRWHTNRTVDDALGEAEQLIEQFKNGSMNGDATQPPEPISRAIPYATQSAFLVPPPISTFNGFEKLKSLRGAFFGKYSFTADAKTGSSGRGIVLDANFGDTKVNCDETFSGLLGYKGKDIRGEWFYLSDQLTQESLREILRTCFKRHTELRRATEHWIALIFEEESGQANLRRRVWLVARAFGNQGRIELIRTFPYLKEERRPRIPGLEGLEAKTITLVGCGSLGSKIAASLAATGVVTFNLIDYDYFEPCNTVRHELGIESFGLNKAIALRTRLCSLNPAVARHSIALEYQVAATESIDAERRFYELVQKSDLVVDATALHSVSHFINRLAFQTQIPALFVSVTNGAWSGEVVRVIPGKTACWDCWNEEYFESRPPAKQEAADELFAPGCEQPTFTGTTYEVGIVANLAASMAVDTLLGRREFGDISNNYIRWSGRDNTGRPHFRTDVLPTSFREGCPFRPS